MQTCRRLRDLLMGHHDCRIGSGPFPGPGDLGGRDERGGAVGRVADCFKRRVPCRWVDLKGRVAVVLAAISAYQLRVSTLLPCRGRSGSPRHGTHACRRWRCPRRESTCRLWLRAASSPRIPRHFAVLTGYVGDGGAGHAVFKIDTPDLIGLNTCSYLDAITFLPFDSVFLSLIIPSPPA